MHVLSQKVNLKGEVDDSYNIYFVEDFFQEVPQSLDMGRKYAIITDSNIRPLYAERLKTTLEQMSIECEIFSFPAGEQSKTIETCAKIADEMSKLKFGRDSTILALGGGVVGDVAGFIASIFNRGIPYIQIPTSVLAQADSAVGGKTAVDTQNGKNLLGVFKQPAAVYVDVNVLDALPEKEIRNGLAETIKHSIIQDFLFLKELKELLPDLISKKKEALMHIAMKNCKIKGNVVEKDPKENGFRRILNYGHTVGHAIEKLSDYKLSHGECVSIGMMATGRIAIALHTGFNEDDLKEQKEILEKAGLPTTIPSEFSNDEIIEVTSRDKKAKDGCARYCLPTRIGAMHDFGGDYVIHVDNETVREALDATR